MNSKRTILTGSALAAMVLVSLPFTAQADEAGKAQRERAGGQVSAQADGNFYAYEDENRTGRRAQWSGNSDGWGWMSDNASSVWNNGYPGGKDDVVVYKHAAFSGPKRGIYNGTVINDLSTVYFDGTSDGMNDDITSHEWVALP